MNEKILKDIDEIIMTNRVSRQFAGTEMTKDSLRKSNDVLARARTIIKNAEKDIYEKGLNDAWDLAQKIGGVTHPDYYCGEELRNIFGCSNCTHVFNHYSYDEALAKVQEYEKKKAEEEAKLVPGDVVTLSTDSSKIIDFSGIYLNDDERNNLYVVFLNNEQSVKCFNRNVYKIKKTGKHVNLEGWDAE